MVRSNPLLSEVERARSPTGLSIAPLNLFLNGIQPLIDPVFVGEKSGSASPMYTPQGSTQGPYATPRAPEDGNSKYTVGGRGVKQKVKPKLK